MKTPITRQTLKSPEGLYDHIQHWWNCSDLAAKLVKENATLTLCVTASEEALVYFANNLCISDEDAEAMRDSLHKNDDMGWRGAIRHIFTEQLHRMLLKPEPEIPEQVHVIIAKHGYMIPGLSDEYKRLEKMVADAYELGKLDGGAQ